MLVLNRKITEEIQIGDSIRVTVVRIGPNAVRLGIVAPEGVRIVRSELVADRYDGETREDRPDVRRGESED